MPQGKINLTRKSQRIALIDENRYITRVDRYSTVKAEDVVTYAAKSANVPESAITSATLAIRDAIEYFVQNGHTVNLGKFGFLSIGVRGKAAVTREEVSADLVERLTLKYQPSAQVKALISQVSLN